MKDRYCLPVIKSAQAEVLRAIEESEANYGFFEIWLDYIEDLNDSFAPDLSSKYPGRTVFVFRRRNLEPIKMPLKRRKKILDELSDKDCLVDLDITVQAEDLEYAQGKNLKKIVSYHNYDSTPEGEVLKQVVARMKDHSPYIFKLAAMCHGPEDAQRLISMKKDFMEGNQKHIVIGMGDAGKTTRIFGALWGDELIFIPETDEEASAPGQMTRQEFEKIMERAKK